MNSATRDKPTILIVDDTPDNIMLLSRLLKDKYQTKVATNGSTALQIAAASTDLDLILLDVMMPGLDGFEVVRRLRGEDRHVPVLFLTARDAVEDKVLGLHTGGDDYVTKPFSLAELVARAQAILRRTASELPGDVLRFGDLVLDEGRHEVHRGETPIALTATEFSLLRYFMLNPRRVLSKAQILQNVWRYDFGGNTNVVETYVSYLRRKLDAAGSPLIRTVRQAGYMLESGDR
jgi:two-component system OmpR family response regulator